MHVCLCIYIYIYYGVALTGDPNNVQVICGWVCRMTRTQTHAHTHERESVHAHTQTDRHTHTRTHTHTHTHTHMYIYFHIYVYIPSGYIQVLRWVKRDARLEHRGTVPLCSEALEPALGQVPA